MLVRIGGVAVPANPTGSYIVPDVTLDQSAPVTLELEARKIPPGTVVQLTLTPETGTPQAISSTPLAGNLRAVDRDRHGEPPPRGLFPASPCRPPGHPEGVASSPSASLPCAGDVSRARSLSFCRRVRLPRAQGGPRDQFRVLRFNDRANFMPGRKPYRGAAQRPRNSAFQCNGVLFKGRFKAVRSARRGTLRSTAFRIYERGYGSWRAVESRAHERTRLPTALEFAGANSKVSTAPATA